MPDVPSWATVTVPVRPETLVTGPYFADSLAKSEIVEASCVPVCEDRAVASTFVTLPRPTSEFVSVIVPVRPATLATGAAAAARVLVK